MFLNFTPLMFSGRLEHKKLNRVLETFVANQKPEMCIFNDKNYVSHIS